MHLRGNLVNVFTEDIYPVEITFNTTIESIRPTHENYDSYLLPGFIDAHTHIESSMLCPSRFAQAVVPHGTTTVIADPHEIANVLGKEGISYMIRDTKVLKVHYTAPSCVPATPFETAGAAISSSDIDQLFSEYHLISLGEVMNVPGVIAQEEEVTRKIEIAHTHGKPIDGHAPQLSGVDLQTYVGKGISTDHECTTLREAQEKQSLGMKIMIREGAARNLKDLIGLNYDRCFLVSDDLNPEEAARGHLDAILRKAVSHGVDPVKAVKMVTLNPADHYHLTSGIAPGNPADIVVVSDLNTFSVNEVFIDGILAAKGGIPLFTVEPQRMRTSFSVEKKRPEDFTIKTNRNETVKVRLISIVEGQIHTKADTAILPCINGEIVPDPERDILKLAVVERYGHNNVGKAFVRGFHLKDGALASSVAHDSHNIIAVGTSDTRIAEAVNTLISMGGGIAACGREKVYLPLPVAGLMSYESVTTVAETHRKVREYAQALGCTLENPFTQLSFLALLVIPELKLSDKGLFDSSHFTFVDVVV